MVEWTILTPGKKDEYPEIKTLRVGDFDLRVYGPCGIRYGWMWRAKHAPFDAKPHSKEFNTWGLSGPHDPEKTTYSEFEAKRAALATVKAYAMSTIASIEKARNDSPEGSKPVTSLVEGLD